MKSNTVFLIMSAMMKNFYNYFIEKVSAVFEDIPSTSRIKRFIFKFIRVAGKWIRRVDNGSSDFTPTARTISCAYPEYLPVSRSNRQTRKGKICLDVK
ncbi:hypothetical protein [Seramator thermalis]|jgi:fibrillarin-like rRNA methylase|uniref:hypothetical protein n=1 Tax=Seramator thermalis TaxID=2496270 RepID=UPI001EED516F|nr:hypothetical protein [Seramator thermalis]